MLIALDHGPDRQYLSTLCRYQGFASVEADDEPSALRLLEEQRPDLVIGSARLPPVGGYELVRRIRAMPGAADVPIVFYAQGIHEREARALAEACDVPEVLTPTSAPELIVDRIHALVARARQRETRAEPAAAERLASAAPNQQASSGPIDRADRPSLQLIDMVQELAAAERQLTAVAAMAERFTRERAQHELLPVVVDALRTITNAEYAVGGLFDQAGGEAADRALVSAGATRPEAWLSARLSAAFRVAMLRRASVRWEGGAREVDLFDDTYAGPHIAAGLAVPLATPARVHGWIAALNLSATASFSERDEQAAAIIGSQAGGAFENTELIKELEQRTEALQTTAAHTTFALEAARTGVWTWEVQSQRFHGSDALNTVLALPPSYRLETLDDLLDLVPEREREPARAAFEQAARELSGLHIEFTVHRPDGTRCMLHASGRVSFDAQGRATHVHGVLVDITDRRLLEAQLRQAQRVETVGLLAGGIAHDFNNMLTAILGHARLAEDAAMQSGDPLEDIQQIAKAAERASLLTRQLLTFSRQPTPTPSRLDLNAILEDLSGMLRRLIGANIHVSLARDTTHPMILADRSQIDQIVMNLVVNARDAMPTGGRLDITTSVVRLGAGHRVRGVSAVPGRYAVLSISDTGSGIPDEVREKIFDPFFTTKERGQGTGLGLSTVLGIVRQSGGYIDVLTGVGRGSTFLVYLPMLEGANETTTPSNEAAVRGGAERILVVEDESEVRRLVKTVLERAGYRVTDAADPREAEQLSMTSPEPFALLITDIVMPGGTGGDLYRRLVSHRPSLRVLFMSGFPDDDAVAQTNAQPGTAFLQKPFTIDALVRRVREVLD